MVYVKEILILSTEGFAIYHESFGVSKKDKDMVGSLFDALLNFMKEVMEEEKILGIRFGGGDLIIEQGKQVLAIISAVLTEGQREQEELTFRNQLIELIHEVENNYQDNFKELLFQSDSFLEIGSMVHTKFFGNQLVRISLDDLEGAGPFFYETLVFKLTPRGLKRYRFYKNDPVFLELTKNFPREKIDQILPSMHENNSLIHFKDFKALFYGVGNEKIISVLYFLAKKGILEVFSVER